MKQNIKQDMPPSKKTSVILHNINHAFERFIPVTTPLAIALGFLLPNVFINLRMFVPLLFGIMTFSGALKLRASEFGKTVRSPMPIILFFIAAHVLMPVIAMFSTSLLFVETDVISGFVLLFAGPTAVSGFIWVSILKGDMALCLTLILFDTLLAPLIVPGTLSALMGERAALDMMGIAISLLFMIVLPTIIGVTVNETSKGKVPAVICPWLDPFAKLSLFLVIATNAAIISPGVKFDNPLVWKAAAVTIALTFAGFFLVKLIAVIGKCRAPKDITLIISGGLRNNSAVMTIAAAFFPQEAVIPTLMSIIFQQTIMAIVGKTFIKRKSDLNNEVS